MFLDTFHFSFTVSDLDASVDWYTEVLGLELVHRQTQDNDYTRRLVGMPGAVLEIAQFRIPGVRLLLSTHMLELVEYRVPRGERPPLPTNNVGVAHLAFMVDNADAEHERLRARGVRFRDAPVEITAGANRGGKSAYFTDPDGITLEIVQPPAHRLRQPTG